MATVGQLTADKKALDPRTIVENEEAIDNITQAYVGLIIYNKENGKLYKVTEINSLSGKVVNSIVLPPSSIGAQPEINNNNKLSADNIVDGTTNKVVTQTDKTAWNGKQDALTPEQLSNITKGGTALQPIQTATEDNFVAFDEDGNIKDSGCNEAGFIKGVKQNGEDLTKDANGKVNVTVENGKSAYILWCEENNYDPTDPNTPSIDTWLASLKANIGAFQFVQTDVTAEAALTTIGSTYANAISSVSPLQSTLSIILLMNDTNNTKTMMIATQDDGNSGFEFVYAGDLQSAMPSNVLTEDDVDDEPTAGSDNLVKSGGVKDALDAITGTEDIEIDLSQCEYVQGVIGTSDEIFRNNGSYGTNNGGKLVPVISGETIVIQPQSTAVQASIWFLKNGTLANGSKVDTCNTLQYESYPRNTTVELPIDCNYLFVNVYAGSLTPTDRTPTYIKYAAKKGLLDDKQDKNVGAANAGRYLKVGASGDIEASVFDVEGNIGSIISDIETLDNTITDINRDIEDVESNVNVIDAALPKVSGWIQQDTSEGLFMPIANQVSGNVGDRIKNGVLYGASSEYSLTTLPIPIDPNKRYKLKTVVSSYFDGVAYYSNDDYTGYIGNDVFYSDSETTMEEELTIPEGANYMVLASKNVNTAYEVSIYGNNYDIGRETEIQSQAVRIGEAEDDIEQAQEDILTLFGIISGGDVPPENAIKYVPTHTLYLGPNILNIPILDISSVTYDSDYWTIENGMPKYLGNEGGGQDKTFKFNALLTEGDRFLASLTVHTDDSAYEGLFYLRIGNGNLVDTYTGAASTVGGLISDGGQFEIVPQGTKAFDVTSIALQKCLASSEAQGYSETKVLTVNNVDCGNSATTMIDGKWNVAVGPTGNCMAKNVNGSRSVAIGLNALRDWENGLQNVAIGTFALAKLKSGNRNVAIGSDCLWKTEKANDNVAIGRSAMEATVLGPNEICENVAVGYMAMKNIQNTSCHSVSIGWQSNYYGAAKSVFIGWNCTTSSTNSGITNTIAIGYDARATKSNQCVLGNDSVSEFVLGGGNSGSVVLILGTKKLVLTTDGSNNNIVTWEDVS